MDEGAEEGGGGDSFDDGVGDGGAVVEGAAVAADVDDDFGADASAGAAIWSATGFFVVSWRLAGRIVLVALVVELGVVVGLGVVVWFPIVREPRHRDASADAPDHLAPGT